MATTTGHTDVPFYRYTQEQALEIFVPQLRPHQPLSNIIYRRLQTPQNEPSRHCVFASTIPPPRADAGAASTEPSPLLQDSYTLLFSDRSRHSEAQIWLFNPLTTLATRDAHQETILRNHMRSAFRWIRDLAVPEAPGWPFRAEMVFASVQPGLAEQLLDLAREAAPDGAALGHCSKWQLWTIPTKPFASTALAQPLASLPDGFSFGRVGPEEVGRVVETSHIKRIPATLLRNPSVAIFDPQHRPVAWGYIDFCGTLATFYVEEEYRGKGFAKQVAAELLKKLGEGEFAAEGFADHVPWVQAEVSETNDASNGLMKSLGGSVALKTHYIRVNGDMVKW